MKRTYENFSEIADDFCNGDCWPHGLSKHTVAECLPWQHGVCEFAKFLDTGGIPLSQKPDIYPKLWKNIRTHKPEKIQKHEQSERG